MVLIGIVVPVVMRGISIGLQAAERARNTAQAATLGEGKLIELMATRDWSLMSSGGDFSPDWPQYRWSCQTVSRDFSAVEVVLQVSWMERGVEQSLALSTMAYDDTLTTTGTETETGTGTTR